MKYILIIIILIVIVGGGIFAWQYFGAPKDETVNWKNYKNEQFGFEVKYPIDWLVNSETDEHVNIGNPPETMGGDAIYFEFSRSSEKDWVNENLLKNLDTNTQKIIPEGIKTFAGVNWSVYDYKYKNEPQVHYRWITKRNNVLYIFSTETPNNATKFLSTFKFTK